MCPKFREFQVTEFNELSYMISEVFLVRNKDYSCKSGFSLAGLLILVVSCFYFQ